MPSITSTAERYQLASYVVMPNHVHVLFSPTSENKLENILHSWETTQLQSDQST